MLLLYLQKLMDSKGKMAELAERKCVFNWKFSCDNKSERLIEAGYARIQNIMRCSGIYNDDLHISLQEKLENNANLTIDCHKSCVSSYTSTHHVKVFKKRKHSQESSSYIPPKTRRQSSACGMFDLLHDCLFCGEKCELKKDSKNPSRWRAAYKFRQILSPDRKTTLKESILETCSVRKMTWLKKLDSAFMELWVISMLLKQDTTQTVGQASCLSIT